MGKKQAYIIIGVVILTGFAAAWFTTRQKNNSGDTDKYFISTAGQSNKRIKALDLDKPSEDSSAILNASKLILPKNLPEDSNYAPNPELQWIINIKAANGAIFKKTDLMKLFNSDWHTAFEHAELYGYSPVEKAWTYITAGDAPSTFSSVQVGIYLLGVYNDEKPNYDAAKLEKYIAALNKKIKLYPAALALEITEPVANAVTRAKTLVALSKEFNEEAIIQLKSDNPFDGATTWDALQCTGLKWGDEDLFHWPNETGYGHDHHFSVWTSTDPGYFLPEEIKAGHMNPGDLMFGFTIPRSVDPEHVFDAMLHAVKYCQMRLGGTLQDADGNPFDEAKEKQHLLTQAAKMKAKGLVPGSSTAMSMF